MQKIFLILFCLILLLCDSCKKKQSQEVNISPADPPVTGTFYLGADLSYINEIEYYGGVYRDSGLIRDPYEVLENHGANLVRVRLWHDPQWLSAITGGSLYSDLADAEKSIRRAKALGMAVLLDFHYSDTWADAGKQAIPEAWKNLVFQALCDTVYGYTFSVLNYLKSKGLTPDLVQIGNEINSGILFPKGQVVDDNWTPFGKLLNAGIRAVRDFSDSSAVKPEIILHVAKYENAEWWIGKITESGKVSDFDILGISHYAKWSTVNEMSQITSITRNILNTYGKKVMIVETAYPWTGENADGYVNIMGPADSIAGYPLTPGGQLAFMKALTKALINGGGYGIVYWEPGWITSPMPDRWGIGSSWDNCTLFDFTGNVIKSMDYMKYPVGY